MQPLGLSWTLRKIYPTLLGPTPVSVACGMDMGLDGGFWTLSPTRVLGISSVRTLKWFHHVF